MELGKSLIIAVGPNDYHIQPTLEHLFAEIVLLNKEVDGLHPTLYQLRNNTLEAEDLFNSPKCPLHLPDDAFFMIGSVVYVDKKKKQILLRDQENPNTEKTVSYKHLIVASKARQVKGTDHDEFSIAVNALLEAQKINKNFSEFLRLISQDERGDVSTKELFSRLLGKAKKQTRHLDNLAQAKMNQDQKGNTEFLAPEKCLWEVQL